MIPRADWAPGPMRARSICLTDVRFAGVATELLARVLLSMGLQILVVREPGFQSAHGENEDRHPLIGRGVGMGFTHRRRLRSRMRSWVDR